MSISTHYSSIAIVETHMDNTVTIESISVTEGECVLSGAWDFEFSEVEKIESVLSGKLIIQIGKINLPKNLSLTVQFTEVDFAKFLDDARQAAAESIKAFETFKSEDPAKRKKLVAPDFYDWPTNVDFNLSAEHLESIGKMATPAGTPEKFQKTLSAARLLKHFIEMWHTDERERINRKYVEGDDAKVTILPESWLDQSI